MSIRVVKKFLRHEISKNFVTIMGNFAKFIEIYTKFRELPNVYAFQVQYRAPIEPMLKSLYL
jgi:hypothetical protein